MNKDKLFTMIKSHKPLLFSTIVVLILIYIFVNWKITNNECGSYDSSVQIIGGQRVYQYKVTNQAVCYQRTCTVYDNPEYRWCKFKEKMLGYRKIKGADPETFAFLPQEGIAIDKNGIYDEASKQAFNSSLTYAAYYLGYILQYCDKAAQNNFEHISNNNPEKVKALCTLLKNKVNEGQQRVR